MSTIQEILEITPDNTTYVETIHEVSHFKVIFKANNNTIIFYHYSNQSVCTDLFQLFNEYPLFIADTKLNENKITLTNEDGHYFEIILDPSSLTTTPQGKQLPNNDSRYSKSRQLFTKLEQYVQMNLSNMNDMLREYLLLAGQKCNFKRMSFGEKTTLLDTLKYITK